MGFSVKWWMNRQFITGDVIYEKPAAWVHRLEVCQTHTYIVIGANGTFKRSHTVYLYFEIDASTSGY